jgi:hypothetical protein
MESTCTLCQTSLSIYTCPNCKIPYCSLTCFKSPSHEKCSEIFYHAQITQAMGHEPLGTSTRQQTMEMLQRFQDEEEFEEDCLEERLMGLDLDEADPDEILACLSPKEADEFERLVRNGGLLEGNQGYIWTPWWMELKSKASFVIEVDVAEVCGYIPDVISTPPFVSLTRARPSPLILNNVLDLMYRFLFLLLDLHMRLPLGTLTEISWELHLTLVILSCLFHGSWNLVNSVTKVWINL